jgi:hypothetical protein
VVVLVAEVPESFRNRLEPRRLGLVPERVVCVRAIDDSRKKDHGRIPIEAVLPDDRVKGTLLAFVTQLDSGNVIRRRAFAFSDGKHLLAGNEEELRIRVHEPADEPWAGDPVHFDVLARDPFHDFTLRCPAIRGSCLTCGGALADPAWGSPIERQETTSFPVSGKKDP